jgi:hypothetical protein
MKSRQEKLSLFILLAQGLGLLLTLIGSFIGGIYMFNGEWLYAFPLSVFFVVALYYLVIFFCKEKENRRRKGYPKIFYYLFGAYGLLAMILSFFVLHFFNVEINEKEEIQASAYRKIETLKGIYTSYDDQYQQFLVALETTMNYELTQLSSDPSKSIATKARLGQSPYNLDGSDVDRIVNSPDISQQIKTILASRSLEFNLHKKAVLSKNSTIQVSTFEDYIKKQEKIISTWDRFSVASSLSELNGRITEDYDALNVYLTGQTNNQYSISLNNGLDRDETLIAQPTTLASKHMGPASLLFLIFFNVLILLPYFLTRGKTFGNQ